MRRLVRFGLTSAAGVIAGALLNASGLESRARVRLGAISWLVCRVRRN